MQVVALIAKCSESNGEAVQLGVVRALLTVTTAEHFVLHGDCLMQVFPSNALHTSCLALLEISLLTEAFTQYMCQLSGKRKKAPKDLLGTYPRAEPKMLSSD